MQTASILVNDKKKSNPLAENIPPANGLPVSFFDYFDWSKRAICAGVQISMFFTASSTGMAKIICGRCEVKSECLIWALMYKEQGVWGGTTDDERKKLLPHYNIKAYIDQALRLKVYYPKRSAAEVRDYLEKAV